MGIPYSKHWSVLLAIGLLGTGLARSQEPNGISDQLRLALDLERRGDAKAAERLLLRLLAAEETSPTAAVVLNNLAVLYMSIERYGDAERSFHRSIEIFARGNNQHRLAQAKLGLASLYLNTGRIAEAKRIASPEFVASQDSGENQLQTRALLANLAVHKKEFGTAEQLYSQVLDALLSGRNGTYGDEIPTKIATVLNNLAMVALKQGRIAGAHMRMGISVLVWKLLAGADSLIVAKVMHNFGVMCMEAKEYRQAEKFFFQTSKIIGKLWKDPSRLALSVQVAHAEALKKMGRKAEARQMQKQAEETRKGLLLSHVIDYRDLREAH